MFRYEIRKNAENVIALLAPEILMHSDMNTVLSDVFGMRKIAQRVAQIPEPGALGRHGREKRPSVDSVCLEMPDELVAGKAGFFLNDHG